MSGRPFSPPRLVEGSGVRGSPLHNFSERLPVRAIERDELQLADRAEIVGRSVDRDAGIQHRGGEILEVGRLFHYEAWTRQAEINLLAHGNNLRA